MTPSPPSSDVVRRVMRHPGVRDYTVAEREGLRVDVVRSVRMSRGHNAQDGTRYVRPNARGPRSRRRGRAGSTTVDYDRAMRENTGVCP